MAVVQSSGFQWPGVLAREIATETAVSVFGIAAGAFGGLAGLVASRQLQGITGRIPVGRLAVPVAVAGISTVLGAFLLPSG